MFRKQCEKNVLSIIGNDIYLLFRFFVEILKANGPLPIDDSQIQQEMEVFPFEAVERIKQVGGLADFLKQSLQFAVIDDVIALLSDSKKARQLALKRRKEKEAQGYQPTGLSAWKTVGKGVNNIDSLSESVTPNESFPSLYDSAVPTTPSVSNNSSVPSTLPSLPRTLNSVSSVDSTSSLGKSSRSLSAASKASAGSQWSAVVNSYDVKHVKTPDVKMTLSTMDTVDDILIETPKASKKSSIDDIDDFDDISDTGSDYRMSENSGSVKYDQRLGVNMEKLGNNLSRSSSKSDLSDSIRSDFSAGGTTEPKPLKPLNVGLGGIGLLGTKKGSGIFGDKIEKDFDSSSSVFSKDENESGSRNSAQSSSSEVQKAGEEFIRKSDEKFVSELAESVVDKLYEGKYVSEQERMNTLSRVSADIWKDFERSAKAQKTSKSNLRNTTPEPGVDYSKNMGKFAADYMKKHYDESSTSETSPISNITSVYPQKTNTGLDAFQTNSGFNSMLHLPSSADSSNPLSSSPQPSFLPSQSSTSESSGYNLFSGPSWSFNSFGSSGNSPGQVRGPGPLISNPAFPLQQPRPPAPGTYIQPPISASSFYKSHIQNVQNTGFPAPDCPSPLLTGMPAEMVNSANTDQCTKVGTGHLVNRETMTDICEPYKTEYLKLKEERERMFKMMTGNKVVYDELLKEYKAKEQEIQVNRG